MPEIVTDGVDGVLVDELTAEAVAAALITAGCSEQIQVQALARSAAVREHFTWERAAAEALDAIRSWS